MASRITLMNSNPFCITGELLLGYKLIKTNHHKNTAHGGVAILNKTSLFCQQLSNYSYDHFQSGSILIKLNNIPVTNGAFYSFSRYIITKLDYFRTIKNNCIISGDLQCQKAKLG